MGFFDKVKEAFDSTSKEVTKATKKVVNSSKIQSQIVEEGRIVRDAYIEIGQKYYELHRDEECEFAELCQKITDGNAKIDALQIELEKIKGLQRCPSCGNPVALENSFCPKCGAKMPEVVPEPEAVQETEEEAAPEEVAGDPVQEDKAE